MVLEEVAGPGGWAPRESLGDLPIRFPGLEPADDQGRHVDAAVAGPDGSWAGSGRPEMLVPPSEVGRGGAPTRIRAGSHHDFMSRTPVFLTAPVTPGQDLIFTASRASGRLPMF